MANQALFSGLVVDEKGRPVDTAIVGGESCYVVDDAGFHRHISSEHVDRQVLAQMQEMLRGSEGFVSEQAAKILGQDDVFSKAMIEQQLKHMDKQFDALLQAGIPENVRAYMGMMGFKVVINYHGEVLSVEQPGEGGEGGEE